VRGLKLKAERPPDRTAKRESGKKGKRLSQKQVDEERNGHESDKGKKHRD